jgi:hypothetical protein
VEAPGSSGLQQVSTAVGNINPRKVVQCPTTLTTAVGSYPVGDSNLWKAPRPRFRTALPVEHLVTAENGKEGAMNQNMARQEARTFER